LDADVASEVPGVVRLEDRMHCGRCKRAVRPIRPWPYWRQLRVGYYVGLGMGVCAFPVILADGFFMIPTFMLYMSAIGPLNRFARQRATCSRCSAVL
jgi:ribosomal protein S27AE